MAHLTCMQVKHCYLRKAVTCFSWSFEQEIKWSWEKKRIQTILCMWTGCLHPYLVVCQRNTHSEAKFSSQSYSESSECKTDHVIKVHISVHTWAKCWHEERDIGAYMFQPKQSPSEKWTWTGLEWHSFLRSKVNWGMREMRTKARPFLTGKDYRGLWVWGYNAPQTASVLLPWLPLSSMVSEPGTLHLATFTKVSLGQDYTRLFLDRLQRFYFTRADLSVMEDTL